MLKSVSREKKKDFYCPFILEHSGTEGSLTRAADYLAIGIYATDSWAHSSFGRKIEKAVEYREKGAGIAIASEEHWRRYLPEQLNVALWKGFGRGIPRNRLQDCFSGGNEHAYYQALRPKRDEL